MSTGCDKGQRELESHNRELKAGKAPEEKRFEWTHAIDQTAF
jgi:hypothetical protein